MLWSRRTVDRNCERPDWGPASWTLSDRQLKPRTPELEHCFMAAPFSYSQDCTRYQRSLASPQVLGASRCRLTDLGRLFGAWDGESNASAHCYWVSSREFQFYIDRSTAMNGMSTADQDVAGWWCGGGSFYTKLHAHIVLGLPTPNRWCFVTCFHAQLLPKMATANRCYIRTGTLSTQFASANPALLSLRNAWRKGDRQYTGNKSVLE